MTSREVIALTAALFGIAVAVDEATAAPATVTISPGGAAVKEVVLRADQPGGKATALFFAQVASEPVTNARLLLGPLVREGIASAATDFVVQFDGKAPGDAGVEIPAEPAVAAIGVSLTSPGTAGVYRSELYALHDRRAERLTTLVLEVEPLIEVVGIGTEGIKLERRAAAASRTIRIRSNATEPLRVNFEADTLTTPTSGQQELTLTLDGRVPKTEETFTAGETKSLTISAEATIAGTYTSTLTLSRGALRQAVPVSIVRTREAPTLEALNIDRIQRTASWRQARFWRDFEVRFTALLHETAGDTFATGVDIPRLVRVDGTSEVREDVANVTVTGDGKAPPYSVGNDSHVPVNVGLGTLGPGTYNGILRLQVAGQPAVDTPFVLTIRRSAWLCAFLIAAGMVIALLLRRYLGGGQASFRRRARLSSIRNGLLLAMDEAHTPEELAVIGQLRGALENLRASMRTKTAAEVDAALDALARRYDYFTRWRRIWLQVAASRTRPHALEPEAYELRNEIAGGSDDLDAIATKLGQLEIKAEAAGRLSAIRDVADKLGIDEMRDNITSDLKRLSGLDPEEAQSLAQQRELALPDEHPELLPRAQGISRLSWPRLRARIDVTRRLYVIAAILSWMALLLLAVVVGLQLLWQGDTAWGDFGDCIAAFLWGAGLQQVGGVTFDGLTGFGERVGKPAPAN